ncbi:hypothetical protein HBI56_222760 [Parastagonospora nodorum]|uniref:Secreted protein n=1 Tax=Phaeosphaeria nodorum (strain SN15 / ATCC MYA-4574 / FGSC 10173) TaxID=321614 RepID=A0A7U2HXK5_PHANO|nr:hypothetical protein HBH56_148210 [Parastagonospora nodorum]QRC94094.1 hypothetical protein JI435_430210 [Parastagonospora nodorum SN15]KAH3923330.1 hypothetical protein HBH54_212850 [Parastagonospora nodorum]KAH3946064.1 hypothetical protein HBH53_135670 [Parastagonospora nodorum]KAH3983611.1 hypothetical protein HBH52_064350 [Parastagonospora nodorum]
MSRRSISLSIAFLRFLCETLLLTLYRLEAKPADGKRVSSPGQVHAVLPPSTAAHAHPFRSWSASNHQTQIIEGAIEPPFPIMDNELSIPCVAQALKGPSRPRNNKPPFSTRPRRLGPRPQTSTKSLQIATFTLAKSDISSLAGKSLSSRATEPQTLRPLFGRSAV